MEENVLSHLMEIHKGSESKCKCESKSHYSPFLMAMRSKDLTLIEEFLETVDSTILHEENWFHKIAHIGDDSIMKILVKFSDDPNRGR